jgi:hypothetical protein
MDLETNTAGHPIPDIDPGNRLLEFAPVVPDWHRRLSDAILDIYPFFIRPSMMLA